MSGAGCWQHRWLERGIPDVTRRHMAVNIRKFVLQAHSLDELVALGTLTPQAARFLEAAVVSGLNVLVAGGTQAGKTTLLDFSEFETTAGGMWRLAGCRDYWSKYEL